MAGHWCQVGCLTSGCALTMSLHGPLAVPLPPPSPASSLVPTRPLSLLPRPGHAAFSDSALLCPSLPALPLPHPYKHAHTLSLLGICMTVGCLQENKTHQSLCWPLHGSADPKLLAKGEAILPPAAAAVLAHAHAHAHRVRAPEAAPVSAHCSSPSRPKSKWAQYRNCASFKHKESCSGNPAPLRTCQVCVIYANNLPAVVGSRCLLTAKNPRGAVATLSRPLSRRI